MKIIHALTILSLAFPPPARSEGSAATQTLQGAQSALGGVNSLLTSVQYAQTQMQGMVNLFAGLQNQTTGLNTAQGQFDQVKQQLAVALAEGSACVEKAKKDTSKYKKATLDGSKLDGTVITCKNYGNVIDSVKKNIDQVYEANQKMACVRNMQNKIGQIADSSKSIFNNLTQAANDVWNTRDQIIQTHQGIVDKLDEDLNGENGIRKQLDKLKELSSQIGNALNAGASKDKDGNSSTGITQRIKNLKRQRVTVANQWYYNLMGQVESCFNSDASQECALGTPAAPRECIRSYLANTGAGSAANRAMAKGNETKFASALMINQGILTRIDDLSRVDVNTPDAFLMHVDKRFNEKLQAMTSTFSKMQVIGNTVNKTALVDFARSKYQACYNSAVQRFRADLASEGGAYKASANAVSDEEAALNNDIKNLVDLAQSSMNSFRTGFNKVYNRDLSQFAADCTAGDNPYASADCLRKLHITMKSGIEGTRQTTTLDNGGQVSFLPGPTTVTLQNLSLDQNGRATLSNTTQQCVGFDECINLMDRYQASHSEQVQSQTKARDTFVIEHNKTVKAAMTGVAAQFTEVSKMVLAAAQGLNEDLVKAGVNASVTTTQITGENLKENEKTKLYDMPENMRAALAGNGGSYTQLGKCDPDGSNCDLADVTQAANQRLQDLAEKGREAAKVKASCIVKKSDYEAIANGIDKCEEETVCSDGVSAQVMSSLESLMKKGKTVPNTDKGTPISDAYESCMDRAESKADKDISSSEYLRVQSIEDKKERAEALQAITGSKADRDEKLGRANRRCASRAASGLEALNQDNRSAGMKDSNSAVIAALRRLENACVSKNEEAAVQACESIKKALKKASPPENEGETVFTEGAGSSDSSSNPLRSAQ